MTDLTLPREETAATRTTDAFQLLKELFAATPLGLLLAALPRR